MNAVRGVARRCKRQSKGVVRCKRGNVWWCQEIKKRKMRKRLNKECWKLRKRRESGEVVIRDVASKKKTQCFKKKTCFKKNIDQKKHCFLFISS